MIGGSPGAEIVTPLTDDRPLTEVARLIDDAEMRATIQKRMVALALPQSN
jgi:hypothetical protein